MISNTESTYLKITKFIDNKKENELEHTKLVHQVERINETTQRNTNQIFDLEADVNLKADQTEVIVKSNLL